jgi:hypothetical protein
LFRGFAKNFRVRKSFVLELNERVIGHVLSFLDLRQILQFMETAKPLQAAGVLW